MLSTPRGIWSPDNGGAYAVVQDLAALAQDVDDAIGAATPSASTTVPGLARYATQAEVNTPVSSTLAVSPVTLREVPYRAFAEAAGIVSTPASGYLTVTFPVGRFSVAPVVTASGGSQPLVSVARIIDVTSTEFKIGIWSLGGAQVAGTGVHWHAVQMTSSTAGG